MTREAISLRRHYPDQVVKVAFEPFDSPASQPFPAPLLASRATFQHR